MKLRDAIACLLLWAASGCGRAGLGSAPSPEGGEPPHASTIRLWSPQSTALVVTPTPTLRFHFPTGVSAAKVEVCADRECREVRWSSEVSVGVARVSTELSPGPWFWHVRARGNRRTALESPTWVFRVNHRRATGGTSWLQGWDCNGDGLDDIPLGWSGSFALGSRAKAHAAQLSAELDGKPCGGMGAPPSCLALGELLPAGDVDGDGFADALAHVGLEGDINVGGNMMHVDQHVLLYRGRNGGIAEPVDSPVCAELRAALPVGDIDGDGFADVAARCDETWRLYRGSERGLLANSEVLTAPVVDALDVNGDGFADIMTGDGLRLGGPTGLGAPVDVAPMPVADVVGAVARDDGGIDFVAGRQGQLTAWEVVLGHAVHAVQRPWSRLAARRASETVAVIGDIDGDGFDDLAEGHADARGWVQVRPGGPLAPKEPVLGCKDPMVDFGVPFAVGDVNGDGYEDLGVSDINDNNVDKSVYFGGPHGVASQPAVTWDSWGRP